MITAFLADIRRHYMKDGYLRPGDGIRIFLTEYGVQALFAHRLGVGLIAARRKAYLWPVLPLGWLLYFLMSRAVRMLYGIRLDLSATIGPGLYIGHFGNIVLRCCRLGELCSISQSVHVEPEGNGPGPVVGDRVWMGAQAQIVGPYTVGTGSTVSAAAIVKRDIPEYTLCMGNPARVVMREYNNDALLGLAGRLAPVKIT